MLFLLRSQCILLKNFHKLFNFFSSVTSLHMKAIIFHLHHHFKRLRSCVHEFSASLRIHLSLAYHECLLRIVYFFIQFRSLFNREWFPFHLRLEHLHDFRLLLYSTNLVVHVVVELLVRHFILDWDDAEVVKHNILNLHRQFDLPALTLCLCLHPRELVVALESWVSTVFLLVLYHYLGEYWVLVGNLGHLLHELFAKVASVLCKSRDWIKGFKFFL